MAAALFFPFDYDFPTHRERNNVAWLDDEPGLLLRPRSIVRSPASAAQLHRRLVSSGGLTIEAWLATADLDRFGAARVVTYSLDTALRNFTLAQDGDALVFRLRTSKTDLNGVRPQSVIGNVFTSLDPMHIAVSYDGNVTAIYLDGEIVARRDRPQGGFDNWDPDYLLAFGNELTGTRPWSGKLFRVGIYDRALSEEEIRLVAAARPPLEHEHLPVRGGLVGLYTFDAGGGRIVRDHSGAAEPLDLAMPQSVIVSEKPFLHAPYRYIDPRFPDPMRLIDVAVNLCIFIPVGFLLYGSARRRTESALLAGLAVVATGVLLTVCTETIQYVIRGRESSLGDVLHNSAGTVIGVAIARVQRSRSRDARKTS